MSHDGSSLYASAAASRDVSSWLDLWCRSHVKDAQINDNDFP